MTMLSFKVILSLIPSGLYELEYLNRRFALQPNVSKCIEGVSFAQKSYPLLLKTYYLNRKRQIPYEYIINNLSQPIDELLLSALFVDVISTSKFNIPWLRKIMDLKKPVDFTDLVLFGVPQLIKKRKYMDILTSLELTESHIEYITKNCSVELVADVFNKISKDYIDITLRRCRYSKYWYLNLRLLDYSIRIQQLIIQRMPLKTVKDLIDMRYLIKNDHYTEKIIELIIRKCKTIGRIKYVLTFGKSLDYLDLIVSVIRPREVISFCQIYFDHLTVDLICVCLSKIKTRELYKFLSIVYLSTDVEKQILVSRTGAFSGNLLEFILPCSETLVREFLIKLDRLELIKHAEFINNNTCLHDFRQRLTF